MNPLGTGGIGLGLNSLARSKSEEQGFFSLVIGNGIWMKFLGK